MNMKRGIWILSAIAISTAVYFTIRFGLRPKPIPVMNATSFESEDQIGAVIYRHLYQDIRAEKVLVLGTDPELKEGQDVWTGFLKTAAAEGLKPDFIYSLDGAELASGEIPPKLKSEIEAGNFVVVLAPSLNASHLLPNSLAKKLDQTAQHPVLALSTFNLSLVPEDIQTLQAQCVMPAQNGEGMKHIDCAKARVSSSLIKKQRSAPTKIWSVIERHGLKEYLVFVHR